MKLPGNLGLKGDQHQIYQYRRSSAGCARLFGTGECGRHLCPDGPGSIPSCCAASAALVWPLWRCACRRRLGRSATTTSMACGLETPIFKDKLLVGRLIDNRLAIGPLHTNQSPSGVFGGGTIGYNMQRGGVVFGIEADFGAMDLNGNNTLSNAPVFFPGAGGAPTLVPTRNGKCSHFNGLLR